ncbi:MAG TPA: hypothetical protein VFG68_07185 [Fimbriiglobus sp.]|nr:hypothetical protein [Fimbriiglobus sp.]
MAAEHSPSARDLVMTQADLPPGIDVPPPSEEHGLSADLLRDIQQLADRVGGMDRLRDIVATLAGMTK